MKRSRVRKPPRRPQQAAPHRLPPWATWLIILAGSFATTFSLFRENLEAKWWVQDDHDIARALGADRAAHLGEFPALLMQTEWGRLGEILRVRFAYHVVRVAEVILWDDNPTLHYVCRTCMLAIGLALIWRAMARWIGLAAAGAVLLFCMTYPFWGDVVCRLGPGETYCALGVGLFVFGLGERAHDALAPGRGSRRRAIAHWMLVLLGALLAMGSKENFLLLLLPLWGVAAWLAVKRRLGAAGIACGVLVSAYGIFSAVCVALAVRQAGHDVYMRQVGLSSTSLAAAGLAQALRGFAWWGVPVLGALGVTLLVVRRRIGELARPLVGAGIILAGLLLVYVSQYVFYSGDWPGKTPRYHFPGVLVEVFYWVAIAALAMDILRTLGARAAVRQVVYWLAVVGVAAGAAARGFEDVRDYCRYNAARTQRFTRMIEGLASRLERDPDRPLVMVSHRRRDVEPTYSIRQFLTLYGARNPVFLKLDWRPGPEATPFVKTCYASMKERSLEGAGGFTPLRKLTRAPRPFAVGFSGHPRRRGAYVYLGRVW
jgi:hypothetical protein